MLHMRQTASGLLDGKKGSFTAGKAKEAFPLSLWNVESVDKDKFALTRPGGQQVRLRTDSQAEAELWVKKLGDNIRKAKEEQAAAQHDQALKLAQKELQLMRGEDDSHATKGAPPLTSCPPPSTLHTPTGAPHSSS